MRSYLLDDISPPDLEKIQEFLDKTVLHSGMEGIYWVQIPDQLLTELQLQHRPCRPHVFAVELGPGWVKLELFVRSLKHLRCSCPGYCTRGQRDYIIRFAHDMVERMRIIT